MYPFTTAHSMRRNRQAFTLIELSLVLVIIGLIVGGVLVGRDLINSASQRAQISQIEKYKLAVNGFKERYGWIPGDMPNQYASQFGFQARSGYPGRGDGNGYITGWCCDMYTPLGSSQRGEPLWFWTDLSRASLISDSFTSATQANDGSDPASDASKMPLYFPRAMLGSSNNYIFVWSTAYGNGAQPGAGVNYFSLQSANYINNGMPYWTSYPYQRPALKVSEAYTIDMKIDDGMPQTGKVTARFISGASGNTYSWDTYLLNGSPSGPFPPPDTAAKAASGSSCYDNGNVASNLQTYSNAYANSIACTLTFEAQF